MSVKNKMWFNENITINETKIRAMDESNCCIIVTEMDENENTRKAAMIIIKQLKRTAYGGKVNAFTAQD